MLYPLAGKLLLNVDKLGAAVGATRAVCEDAAFSVSSDLQVGQTGKIGKFLY